LIRGDPSLDRVGRVLEHPAKTAWAHYRAIELSDRGMALRIA